MHKQQKEKVIIDGDWGGDEMQLATVLLAHPDRVNILGATCVFGNTDHKHVFENARNILHFLKATKIKVYPGAEAPSGSVALPEGDDAHGKDGIGNAELPKSPAPRETLQAVDFLLRELSANPEGTITITVSGPLTNIAQAIAKDPETIKRAKQIIVMGGCTHDMKGHDVGVRRGNINYQTEFNFFQAPEDAQVVMKSGLPITLLPMNCTHQLTLDIPRQIDISHTYRSRPAIKKALLGETNELGFCESAYSEDPNAVKGMLSAPANLDLIKFNSAPVMHDINCALYLLYPESYKTERGDVTVSPADKKPIPFSCGGHTEYNSNPNSNITVATDILNPDFLFQAFMTSLTSRIPPQRIASRARA